LVIDNFFALSVEASGTPPDQSGAFKAYQTAQKAYTEAFLLGSPSKVVAAEILGKLIGAFVNGKPETLMRGLCTVGTPPEKRYALSQLTLELCKLSHTTDSLHLCLLELGLPFAVFDLCLEYDKKVYCTDASSKKGAIVSSAIGRQISEIM